MKPVKIRDMINTQKRKAIIAVSLGMAVFAVSFPVSTVYSIMFPVALIGFAVALGGVTFLEFGLSCPKCRSRIGHTVNYPGRPFAVSPKIRYCPFCGVTLDSYPKS